MYYIAHHGIKGQKWGVKNGPPYPIDSKVKKHRNKSETKIVNQLQEWDDVLRTIPVHSLTSSNARKEVARILEEMDEKLTVNRVVDLISSRANQRVRKLVKTIETKEAISGLQVKMFNNLSAEMDAKLTNPSFKDLSISSKNNCTLCTIAFDLRRRGYDVTAKQAPIDLLYDVGAEDVMTWYPGSSVEKYPIKDSYDSVFNKYINDIKKQPNGARGNAMISWNGLCGHSVAYVVEKGNVVLYDAQTGNKYDNPKDLFSWGTELSYIRLDNITPNWEKIKEAVE